MSPSTVLICMMDSIISLSKYISAVSQQVVIIPAGHLRNLLDNIALTKGLFDGLPEWRIAQSTRACLLSSTLYWILKKLSIK